MSSRFLAIGALGILTAITAVSAVGPFATHAPSPEPTRSAQLHIAGSRSLQQRQSAAGSKFDASLAEISRHVSSVRPGHAVGGFACFESCGEIHAARQQFDTPGVDRCDHDR